MKRMNGARTDIHGPSHEDQYGERYQYGDYSDGRELKDDPQHSLEESGDE